MRPPSAARIPHGAPPLRVTRFREAPWTRFDLIGTAANGVARRHRRRARHGAANSSRSSRRRSGRRRRRLEEDRRCAFRLQRDRGRIRWRSELPLPSSREKKRSRRSSSVGTPSAFSGFSPEGDVAELTPVADRRHRRRIGSRLRHARLTRSEPSGPHLKRRTAIRRAGSRDYALPGSKSPSRREGYAVTFRGTRRSIRRRRVALGARFGGSSSATSQLDVMRYRAWRSRRVGVADRNVSSGGMEPLTGRFSPASRSAARAIFSRVSLARAVAAWSGPLATGRSAVVLAVDARRARVQVLVGVRFFGARDRWSRLRRWRVRTREGADLVIRGWLRRRDALRGSGFLKSLGATSAIRPAPFRAWNATAWPSAGEKPRRAFRPRCAQSWRRQPRVARIRGRFRRATCDAVQK